METVHLLHNSSMPDILRSKYSNMLDHPFHLGSLIINGFTLTVLCSFGIVGNVGLLSTLWCFESFCKQEKPYLITLALWDIFLLISMWTFFSHTTFLMHGLYAIYGDSATTAQVYVVTYFAANLAFAGHVWATVILTVERCMAICHPIWHKTMKPKRTALVLICGVFLVSVAYAIPRLFEPEITEFTDVETNITHTIIMEADILDHHSYHIGYRIVVQMLLTSLGPLCILTILTLRMVYAIKCSVSLTRPDQTSLPCSRRCSSLEEKSTEHTVVYTTLSADNVTMLTLPTKSIKRHSGTSVSSDSSQGSRTTTSSTHTGLLQQLTKRKTLKQRPVRLRSNTRRKRSSLADLEGHAKNPLITLLMVALVTYSLPTLADLLELFLPTGNSIIDYVTLASNFAILLNASSSFYVYLFRSRQLRTLLGTALRKDSRRQKQMIPELSITRVRLDSLCRAQSFTYNALNAEDINHGLDEPKQSRVLKRSI